jgi:hypothetical protein
MKTFIPSLLLFQFFCVSLYAYPEKKNSQHKLKKNYEISIQCSAEERLSLNITEEKALEVGKLIWENECGGNVQNLTFWNPNENFPSLGIGHFIWFPKNSKEPFSESFPQLLAFLKEEGVRLPSWLEKTKHFPWSTRKSFVRAFHSRKMKELRALLERTVSLQAIFITKRLEKTLPKIIRKLPESQKKLISENFYQVAKAPKGLYALIDYVNFKGEGYSTKESYNKQGWGLLQVLQNMDKKLVKRDPVKAFAQSAKMVLKIRVQNSPRDRNEERWLKGWYNRIDSYSS